MTDAASLLPGGRPDLYPVLMGLGGLLLVLTTLGRRCIRPAMRSRVALMGLAVYLAGLAGARFLFVIEHQESHRQGLGALFNIQAGGFAAWGAVVGAAAAAVICARLLDLPLGQVADAAVPGLCLLAALGRTGCFLGGCCYGSATFLPWGVAFAPSSPAGAADAHLHPVQLYEAALMLVLGLALCLFLRDSAPATQFLWLLVGYAVLRLLLGFLRADHQVAAVGLGLSQWAAILAAAAAVTVLAMRQKTAGRQRFPLAGV